MSRYLIFWPVVGHVVLVLALYILLARRKKSAVAGNRVNEDRRGLFDDAWSDDVIQVNNCIRNQFEIPVLFYIATFMLWALDAVGMVALATAWSFFAARIAHAIIHVGNNFVPRRRFFFSLSVLLTFLLVGLVLFRLITI